MISVQPTVRCPFVYEMRHAMALQTKLVHATLTHTTIHLEASQS